MRPMAVLFDLDGTLLHTVPDLAAAVNAMLVDLGRESIDLDQVATYVGKGAENLVHRALTGQMDAKADPTLFEQALAIWHAHYQHLNGQFAQLYPGVSEGLTMLKEAGLSMGVVTNKPFRFAQPLLERTGLADFFQVTVGGDTCAVKKPQAEPLLHACKVLGVQPSQALLIGDSLNDSQAAQAAGMPCWLLPYGYNEGRAIENTPCDRIVPTIAEAAQYLVDNPSRQSKVSAC